MRRVGPVEGAIRGNVQSGQTLVTPTAGKPFTVKAIDGAGLVLLLGKKEAVTHLPWACLEGVVPFLSGRDWVRVGSTYSIETDDGTLDGYLKGHVKRATAGWVAVVLEVAGVIEIDRRRPAKVRLRRVG